MSAVAQRYRLVDRFVAGESVEQAIRVVREFNQRGMAVTLDLLGEGVLEGTEAERAALDYRSLLDAIAESGARSTISIKLTQIGLDISRRECSRNLRLILERARELENFVRIDMEGSRYTEDTIAVFRDAYAEFARHVGIVIQAYLYRSEADVRELSSQECNIRLCKGAYMEPPEIAFAKKRDVDANFKKLTEILLDSPAFAAIATHDEKMIGHALQVASRNGRNESNFELQMLYGVRRDLQQRLHRQGHRLRIYVPFGTRWAPYFMRRLAERPANMLFLLKSLIR